MQAREPTRYPVAPRVSIAADVDGPPGAPAVVFLHGIGQTRHSWRRAARELAHAGYHVVNTDARGHGDSDWDPDAVYTLDSYSDDLRAVLATLPAPPVLVGASMGGAIALCAAGEEPIAALRGIVIVDVVPRVDTDASERIREFMRASPAGFASVEEAADAVAAYQPQRPRPRDPSGLLRNLRRRDDGRLYWHWDPRILAQPWRDDREHSARRLLQAAGRVRVPALLVRGLQSDMISQAAVDEFRSQLPGLEVCDVGGAGHMVAGDRNDVFNHAVRDFLRRHLPIDRSGASPCTPARPCD